MSSPVCPTVKITVWQPASVSGDATLSEGVTKPCATVSHPSVSPVSACQGRCENTKSCCFLFPPPTTPHSLLLLLLLHPLLLHSSTLASYSTLAGWLTGCGASPLMNEVFSHSDVKVCCSDTRSLWGRCGRTPPCLPIYPHTSNSVGAHQRHAII